MNIGTVTVTMNNWIVESDHSILLGISGENAVARLDIITTVDAGWIYMLEIEHLDRGEKNIIPLTAETNKVYAVLTSEMLGNRGGKKLQIRAINGEQVKKSNIFRGYVNNSVNASENIPEHTQTVIDEAVERVDELATNAQSSAAAAETSATNAGNSAAAAERAAQDAANIEAYLGITTDVIALKEDLTEISDVVLFHSSDVKDTTRVPINLKTGTKIRIRRKDGKDFTKNNRVKFWKEDGSTNITYFSIEPSFGKERVIVYTYADASYVSLNIADTDIVVDVYADDTLAEIVKNQESIVSQVKNDIFYDFIDLIGTTRLVFPFVKNDTIIIERVDGKDFEGSNRLMLYGEDNTYIDYYSLAPSFGNKRVITYAKNNPVKYIALNSASTYAIRVTLQSDGKLIGQVADNTNRIIALETEIHAPIADRFVSEMNETIASVRNCMTEPCLVFPKITDIHYAPTSTVFQNFDETIKNMKYFTERIHCDFIANLGDNINGSSSVDTSLSQADYMLSAFNGIGIPYLFCMGNHDTNYDPSPKFDIGQTYRAFMYATPKNAIINKATNGTDFYVDFDGLENRVVFINTNYLGAYVLAEDTKNWFINTVLNTDKLVVLCEHMSTQANQNFSNKIPSETRSEAINNAISTFISNGGKFIQLFGHSHCDYAFTSPWLSIASTCGKFEQADVNSESIRAITGYETTYGLVSPSRTQGNATEQAWDVVVIRPTSRKINLIRFGAGVDREFDF